MIVSQKLREITVAHCTFKPPINESNSVPTLEFITRTISTQEDHAPALVEVINISPDVLGTDFQDASADLLSSPPKPCAHSNCTR